MIRWLAVAALSLSGCATCGPALRLVDSPTLMGGPRVEIVGVRLDGVVAGMACTLPLETYEYDR